MAALRQAIEDGRLEAFAAAFEEQQAEGDLPTL
jgi:queuine/archaeosine tRNA-ribosyltransferase